MNEPDSKKLITGFLILATITSSGALALSGFLTTRANKNEPKTSSLFNNAFSKNKPEDLNRALGGGQNNLTSNLAEDIARGILSTNESGPSLNGIALPPDLNSIIDKKISELELTDSIFALDEKLIKEKSNPSITDYENYFVSLEAILKEAANGDEAESLKKKLRSNPDPSIFRAVSLVYSEALYGVYGLDVPSLALPFHRSVLRSLNVPVVILGNMAQEDPLQAYALFYSSDSLLNEYEAQMIKEFNILSLELENISLAEPKIILGFFEVRRANAFFSAATGIVFDPKNWFENLRSALMDIKRIVWEEKDFIAKMMIAAIKDRLLAQIVNGILNWAQADIIGNWQEYLGKTFGAAASQYLNQASQGFCTNYRNSLLDKLKDATNSQSPLSMDNVLGEAGFNVGCPLENIVQDVDLFYENFYEGGWAGYMALAMPSSNFYGSEFMAKQGALAAAEERRRTRELELVAGEGSAPTEVCEGGGSPEFGICPDGGIPEVTTLGKSKTDLTNRGLGSAIDRIVNANDSEWHSLVDSLVNSALNKLFAVGNKGIKKGGVSGTNKGDPYASCYGYKTGSDDYLKCIENINKTKDTSKLQNTRADLIKEIDELVKNATEASSSLSLALDSAYSAKIVFEQVKISCPSELQLAENEISVLDLDITTLLENAEKILANISILEIFREEVSSHDESDSDFFEEKYIELTSAVDRNAITTIQGEAIGQSVRLGEKLQQATDLLSQCAAN